MARTAPDPSAAFTDLAPRLQRAVARNIQAPECLIEDACQIAWSRWLVHRDEVAPGSMLGWLITTATREALRLLRQQARYVPLEARCEHEGKVVELPARTPGPDQVAELHDRLAEVRRLPVRQQTVIWMQGFGFQYREIAAQTGTTRRSVERQLLRARRKLSDSR
jgi:RNA polymerase sigma factor (sigma-70 family)